MIDYIKMYENMSVSKEVSSLNFPLNFHFKLLSIANDFFVRDEAGNEIAYTRQKMFKLKEWINVFPNCNQDAPVFTIHSEQIIDFGATYVIQNAAGTVLGKVVHEGVKSLWRTSYQVTDAEGQLLFHIREKNPWVAVLDKMVGEVPYLGWLTGLVFNPTYLITRPDGTLVYRLKKLRALWEGKFSLHKEAQASLNDDILILNSVMLFLLIERNKG